MSQPSPASTPSAPGPAATGPATAVPSAAHESLLAATRRHTSALARALVTPAYPATPLFARSSRRWLRRLPYAVAGILTLILVPVTAQILTNDYGVNGGFASVLATAQAAPLLLAVTRPLPAWWIVFIADSVCALAVLGYPHLPARSWPWTPPGIIGYLFLLLALALRETRHTLVAVWLITGGVGVLFGIPGARYSDGSNVLLFVLSGVVLLVGGALRERGDVQRRLAEQETISEAERARRTLLEERARIARELHDVVAHHMSVITVQADSAPYRIGGLPPEAEREFGTIAATARESLAEMRRLLGVLRSEDTRGERAPQPGLDRVPQLVEATVRAGIPTKLSIAKDVAALGPLPQAVDLSAYRIVQEALANVVRHAPGAPTNVSILASADRTGLTVLVVNGPAGGTSRPPLETTGTGHGLVGMRERVRLVGGTLDTGPLPDGGFRLAARLPLVEVARPTAEADAAESASAADSASAEGATGAERDPHAP
ncbi:sensor histidine kinase [Streptomyces sparsogenes]|uniref:histidine kinase n=2 Tax=Streptomyces sparsogenes TaxID=67365 RepID=A0A1R1SIP3_9ACTN|nr:sensor histidine kinase [Streptomyces sparsogenes]OMI38133.1 putative two-component system sensor kinase [Streptomyces sparsogenes DSM 40356]